MISKRIRGALTLLLFIITLVSYCFGWYGIANLGDSDAEMILFGYFLSSFLSSKMKSPPFYHKISSHTQMNGNAAVSAR